MRLELLRLVINLAPDLGSGQNERRPRRGGGRPGVCARRSSYPDYTWDNLLPEEGMLDEETSALRSKKFT